MNLLMSNNELLYKAKLAISCQIRLCCSLLILLIHKIGIYIGEGNPYLTTSKTGGIGNPTSLAFLNPKDALWSFLVLLFVGNYFIYIYSNIIYQVQTLNWLRLASNPKLWLAGSVFFFWFWLSLTYFQLDVISYSIIIRFSRNFSNECMR